MHHLHNMIRSTLLCSILVPFWVSAAVGDDGSAGLARLERSNPWYPSLNLPALTTPKWIAEDGVEAVVVLAIDDMRDPAKYEQYLRPILNRLKQIDGRAPVSIMTCQVRPDDPQLQSWLSEGLSIECHTADHPCPLLQGGDFAKAKSTYERCVELMNQIPGNRPVAFRMPCCDSLNTVSPRFYSEIFNRTTDKQNFLEIDSSVFNFFTSDDKSIPKELVLDANGNERFLKYMPKANKYGGNVHNHFVNFIRNYPYPYVINNSCWQFPCVAPSDWSAQHLHGVNNPLTVEDWKAAIDITVHKQGVFNLVFHPHGWIKAEQVVEMIDHAVSKHGTKVKFLTFREAAERLQKSLQNGKALRDSSKDVQDNLSHIPFRQAHHQENDLNALSPELREIVSTGRSEKLLPILRPDGTSNGLFIHDQHFCWQNEDTAGLPDLIHRVSFEEVLSEKRRAEDRSDIPAVPIGAAVVDITPSVPLRLTGYGARKQESEGVAEKIHARALVFGGDGIPGNDGQQSVLVTVDNCGVAAEITETVFAKLAEKHKLVRERFVICSTHTHSAPALRGFAPNILSDVTADQAARLNQYETELTGKLVEVVDQAIAAQRPGYLSTGYGEAGFAMNRRNVVDGKWVGFGAVADGPVDKRVPVLAAHDEEGRLIAVLANYACHCTTEPGSFNQVSGDWAGCAADFLEADHPGAVALIAIGCGADADPSPRGTHELARQNGRTIADEVNRLLATSANNAGPLSETPGNRMQADLKRIHPNLLCRIDRIDLPLSPLPPREELERRAAQKDVTGTHAQRLLKLLDDGQTVPTTIPGYPVQIWCFGDDLAMVFLGGEVVVDYSIRLNQMFDDSRLWINAYSNDVPCYIASKRLLREGGYEVDSSMVYYGRPGRLAPEAEDLICDTVQRLMPHEFYSKMLQTDFPGPLSPEDALASMKTRPDLKVELVASEPLIHDPVAFDWDVNGRLWVVEMGDYPRGIEPNSGKTGGRVQVLEDTDSDGRYDKATTFLSGIPFPNGICFWRNGVIITSAPDVIYAEDTNGDLQADLRKTLYTGFTEGNQQHRVNGLRWGLDGWLYLANGDSGGEIRAVATVDGIAVSGADAASGSSSSGVNIRGRDVRIQPDLGLVEAVSGQTQFGRERDDFGNWFGNNNSNPIWQYVLEDAYLKRNPHAAAPTVRGEVAEIPGAAPVFPVSRTLARFNDFGSANRFTSACSTMIYRDIRLGQQYYGNALTSEPVHNLVSRLVLNRTGITYRGRRAEDEQASELLASGDNWFRPTMLRTGPDGALYLADMYRQVIEHPEWIPPEYQRRMDLQAGCDRGRIYRLVPVQDCCTPASESLSPSDSKAPAPSPKPDTGDLRAWFAQKWDQIPTEHLVTRLSSPNGWWRDTAHRILLHRQNTTAMETLTNLAKDHSSPAVRLQSLAVLQHLNDDQSELSKILTDALVDASAEVRCHAIRLLEPYMRNPAARLPEQLTGLAGDPDDSVVLQLASSLGESKSPEAAILLAKILRRQPENGWITSAVFSSLNAGNVADVLHAWNAAEQEENAAPGNSRKTDQSMAVFGRLIGQAAALQQPDAVRRPFVAMLTSLNTDNGRMNSATWQATLEVIRNLKRYRDMETAIRKSADVASAWESAAEHAMTIALDSDADNELRSVCARFVLSDGSVTHEQVIRLLDLLQPSTAIEVQQVIVEAAGTTGDSQTAIQLIQRWKGVGPAVRSGILDLLLAKNSWTEILLSSLKDGALAVSDIDAIHRDRLLTHRNESIRQQAEQLLSAGSSTSRTAVVDEWKNKITGMTGNSAAGKGVFEKRCSACHRLQGIGKSIGADLEALKDRSTDALLTAILDPNRAVETKFLSYTAALTNGLTISGMLLNETGNSVTLISSDGKEHAVARADLEELTGTSRSLMPEGLEKDLSPQELTDVMSYVQQHSIPWKQAEGNNPVLVQADDNGVITLPASAAQIYGPQLTYEKQYENLGWWATAEDYAVWTFESKRSGHYTVEFEYACDDSTAGNLIRLSTGTRLLSARVPGTGNWETYRRWTAGTLDVHGGKGRLIVTAAEKPSAWLIDLRVIRLIPPGNGK